jgi:hypothetical protein
MYIEIIGLVCVRAIYTFRNEVWLVDPQVTLSPEGSRVDLGVCLALDRCYLGLEDRELTTDSSQNPHATIFGDLLVAVNIHIESVPMDATPILFIPRNSKTPSKTSK